jgi:hypothetical protein
MWGKKRLQKKSIGISSALLLLAALLYFPPVAAAVSHDLQVTAIVPDEVPTEPAVISQPANNTHVLTLPLVVMGSCQPDLMVRVYDNGELAGSAVCTAGGEFTINITLVAGENVLRAHNYNVFDVPGPDSDPVHVFVDIPLTPEEPVITGTAATETPSATTVSIDDPTDGSVRVFAGTPLDPISKIIGSHATVSPRTHMLIAVTVNIAFIIIVLTLISFIIV